MLFLWQSFILCIYNTGMKLFPRKYIIVIACRANITRSPYVRGYMAHYLKKHYPRRRRKVLVISAGIDASCGGVASDVVQQVAQWAGFSLRGHRSYPLDKRLISVADAVLVMEQTQKERIIRRFPDAEEKTYRLTEFLRCDDQKGWDIADPTGMGAPDYEDFIEDAHAQVERICKALDTEGII